MTYYQSNLRGVQLRIDKGLPFTRVNEKGKEEVVHVVRIDGELHVSEAAFNGFIQEASKRN